MRQLQQKRALAYNIKQAIQGLFTDGTSIACRSFSEGRYVTHLRQGFGGQGKRSSANGD